MNGSEASDKVGARLWNLDAIKPAWLKNTGNSSSCIDKIYKQAVDDQQEYWKYIGRHHTCGDPKSIEPNENTTCGRFAFNMRYLGFTSAVVSTIVNEAKKAPCTPVVGHPSSVVNQLGKDLAKIQAAPQAKKSAAQKAIDDKCYMVPEWQRRKAGDDSFGNVLSYLLSNKRMLDCGVGINKQLMIELDGLKAVASAIVKYKDERSADIAKVGWMTGLANASRAAWAGLKALDLGKLLHDVVPAAWRYATENFDNISCYSNEEQQIRVCQLIPKVALFLITGETLKPAYALLGRGFGKLGEVVTAGATKAATVAGGTRVGQAYLAASDVVESAAKAAAKKAAATKVGKSAIAVKKWTENKTMALGEGAVKAVTAPVRIPARIIAKKLTKKPAVPAAAQAAEASAADSAAVEAGAGAADAAAETGATASNTATQAENAAQNAADAANDVAHDAASSSAAGAPQQGLVKKAVKQGFGVGTKLIKVGINASPARKLEDAHEERPEILQPKVDQAKAEADRLEKEADERWAKEHPNGEEPEWTPSPSEDSDGESANKKTTP